VIAAVAVSLGGFSDAAAQMVADTKAPPECGGSTQKLTIAREAYPDAARDYGKIDVYCGNAKAGKPVASDAMLCGSDYDPRNPLQKAVTISVAAGKAAVKCSGGAKPVIVQK
jgi:hypothetical protein